MTKTMTDRDIPGSAENRVEGLPENEAPDRAGS